jgi:hypothetical protein
MTTSGLLDVVGVISVVITTLDDVCFGTGVSGLACFWSSSGLGVVLYFDVGGGLGDGPALGPDIFFEAVFESGGVIVFFRSRFFLADSLFVAVDRFLGSGSSETLDLLAGEPVSGFGRL